MIYVFVDGEIKEHGTHAELVGISDGDRKFLLLPARQLTALIVKALHNISIRAVFKTFNRLRKSRLFDHPLKPFIFWQSAREIFLRCVDIRDIVYEEYVRLLSVVFQDFQLFSFTARENGFSLLFNRIHSRGRRNFLPPLRTILLHRVLLYVGTNFPAP